MRMRAGDLVDGRYRLERNLGSGGMSVVWHAHDEVLDRPVAMKVLAAPFAAEPEQLSRVHQEAQSAARLLHPNVATVYDYGETADESGEPVPYVVMELLPGRTLSDELAGGALPAAAALRICAEIAAGLAEAHTHGVVHRDIKPSNVILTPAGAKVFDFGIAARAGQPDVEADGTVWGSPAYLAPERLDGNDVMPASDVYALGVLMYRTLTGDLPWRADSPSQILALAATEEPTPLPPIEGVPESVRQVYERCLDREPTARPSAAEVAAVLREALHTGQTMPTAEPPTVVRGRLVRPLALLAAVVAVVLAGTLAAVLALYAGQRRSSGVAADPEVPSAVTTVAAPSPTAAAQPPVRTDPESAPADEDGATVPIATAVPPATGRPATPTGPAPRPGTSFTVFGGAVRVACDDDMARIMNIDPNPGYVIKDDDWGPANEVQVVLHSAENESEIKVRCTDGRPVPKIKESPQS
jgi:eukaryotic-like serine/threonine-protein kinase